jgi:hypothetical protein
MDGEVAITVRDQGRGVTTTQSRIPRFERTCCSPTVAGST